MRLNSFSEVKPLLVLQSAGKDSLIFKSNKGKYKKIKNLISLESNLNT